MAAYAALVSVMQIIDQLHHHPRPPISIHQTQLQSLTQHLSFLQGFLEAYSHAPVYTQEADPMETRIADAAYAAEDVIESYIVDQILARSTTHGGNISSMEFYQVLQTVIEEMELIKVEAMEIQEKKGVRDQLHVIKSASTDAGSSVRAAPQAPVTVGFDDVLYQMLDKITGHQLDLQIIPIVGMGGIGKTTLARNIYASPLVKQHFDVCAWSTISQEYKAQDILSQVLGQVDKGMRGDLSENELGVKLHKYLMGRRYLIVMDDMWNIEAWDKVRMFFPDNENGSRIIVTTRLSNLASEFNYSSGLDMKFLGEASSWSLFTKTVFGEETCPYELKGIGKKIVKGCRGLPLSIVVIGGLLSKSKRTKANWELIGENLNSIVNKEDNESCLQILYTSYNSLPIHIKPCFLYMGIFDEDEKIHVPLLFQLWVAEGFLKPLVGKTLEEAAEEYLEELVDRNLVLVEKRNHCGRLKSCKIHDLLRDLCLREARKVKFLCVLGEQNIHDIRQDLNTQRRIRGTILSEYPTPVLKSVVLKSVGSASLVRSFLGRFPNTLLSNFRMLRMSWFESDECFEEGFGGLVNLRFTFIAGWQHDPVPRTPSSISFFWNLQTLIFIRCEPILEIWKFPQLRLVMTVHYKKNTEYRRKLPTDRNVTDRDSWFCLPYPTDGGDGDVLENLHTLSGAGNLICGVEMVNRIPNVKRIRLHYNEELKELGSPHLNNLRHLHKLESLSLYLSSDVLSHLVQDLSFPHSLKKLTLGNTCLKWEEMNTKIGPLPLLQVLKLKEHSFTGSEWETLEGQFCSLKFLLIEDCDLKQWTTDNTHFPQLEHLVLRRMRRLSEIPSSMGYIPTLGSIKLKYCSKSAADSARKILEEQEEVGNVDLQIEVDDFTFGFELPFPIVDQCILLIFQILGQLICCRRELVWCWWRYI